MAGRNINNLRYADDTTLMAESEELNSLLMKVKEEREKVVREESRSEFSRIIAGLKEKGAEAVILGCTEIGLLVKQEYSALRIFDTTEIHAVRAAELALQD